MYMIYVLKQLVCTCAVCTAVHGDGVFFGRQSRNRRPWHTIDHVTMKVACHWPTLAGVAIILCIYDAHIFCIALHTIIVDDRVFFYAVNWAERTALMPQVRVLRNRESRRPRCRHLSINCFIPIIVTKSGSQHDRHDTSDMTTVSSVVATQSCFIFFFKSGTDKSITYYCHWRPQFSRMSWTEMLCLSTSRETWRYIRLRHNTVPKTIIITLSPCFQTAKNCNKQGGVMFTRAPRIRDENTSRWGNNVTDNQPRRRNVTTMISQWTGNANNESSNNTMRWNTADKRTKVHTQRPR